VRGGLWWLGEGKEEKKEEEAPFVLGRATG